MEIYCVTGCSLSVTSYIEYQYTVLSFAGIGLVEKLSSAGTNELQSKISGCKAIKNNI